MVSDTEPPRSASAIAVWSTRSRLSGARRLVVCGARRAIDQLDKLTAYVLYLQRKFTVYVTTSRRRIDRMSERNPMATLTRWVLAHKRVVLVLWLVVTIGGLAA